MEQLLNIGMPILGCVFTVLWWLLKRRDEDQEKQIDLLFKKHDDDAGRLQELELDIARRHYVKEELDTKFDKLEKTFSEGFSSLGGKFDILSARLMQHMVSEEKK